MQWVHFAELAGYASVFSPFGGSYWTDVLHTVMQQVHFGVLMLLVTLTFSTIIGPSAKMQYYNIWLYMACKARYLSYTSECAILHEIHRYLAGNKSGSQALYCLVTPSLWASIPIHTNRSLVIIFMREVNTDRLASWNKVTKK